MLLRFQDRFFIDYEISRYIDWFGDLRLWNTRLELRWLLPPVCFVVVRVGQPRNQSWLLRLVELLIGLRLIRGIGMLRR